MTEQTYHPGIFSDQEKVLPLTDRYIDGYDAGYEEGYQAAIDIHGNDIRKGLRRYDRRRVAEIILDVMVWGAMIYCIANIMAYVGGWNAQMTAADRLDAAISKIERAADRGGK